MNLRDRCALGVVLVTMVFSAFAIGSAPRWATCTSAFLTCLAAACYLRSRRNSLSRSPLLLFCIAITAVTAIQIVPLPTHLLHLLSPYKFDLLQRNYHALGERLPSFSTITYDIPATLLELTRLASYGLFAYACLRICSFDRGRKYIRMGFVLCATLLACITELHQVFEANRVFGLYEPAATTERLAPLINENHLAAYLALAVPVAISLAVDQSWGWRRWGWIFTAIACAGGCLQTGSRGGALGLFLGIVVVVGLYWGQRRRTRRKQSNRFSPSRPISMIIIGVCALILFGLTTTSNIRQELSVTSSQELLDPRGKVQAWWSSMQLAFDHIWTGVGKGAFEYAFPARHPNPDVTFSHVENQYLQVLVDWGVPFALLLGALLFFTFLRTKKWQYTTADFGTLAGLVGLAFHELADFATALPGTAIAAIALVCTLSRQRRTASATTRRIRVKLVAAIAATIAISVSAATPLGQSAQAAAQHLRGSENSPDFITAAKKQWARHPADYVLAALLAKGLYLHQDPRTFPVLNRALSLHPHHPGLHHLAAHMMLSSHRPEQAVVAYRQALRTARQPKPILRDLLRQISSTEMIYRALPTDIHKPSRIVRALTQLDQTAMALRYIRAVHLEKPNDPGILRMVAQLELTAGKIAMAVAAAQQLHAMVPSQDNTLLLSQALLKNQDFSAAQAVLTEAIAQSQQSILSPTTVRLHITLGTLLYQIGQYGKSRETLQFALRIANQNRSLLSQIHSRLADIEEKLGNRHRAAWQRNLAQTIELQ